MALTRKNDCGGSRSSRPRGEAPAVSACGWPGTGAAYEADTTLRKSKRVCASMEMPSKQRDFVRQAFEIPEAPLDVLDRRIVAELQAAPRLRIAELSRRIGLSGPAVADRLRRLEGTGILSYRAEVSPPALG